MRHPWLILLGALVLGGLGWLSLRLGEDPDASNPAVPAGADLAPRPTPDVAPAPAERPAAEAAAATAQRRTVSPSSAPYERGRIVPLRVLAPLGAPPDPDARVVAVATGGAELARGPKPFDPTSAADWLAAAEAQGLPRLALPFTPEERIDLPLPARGDLVLLVDARYLFLREPVRVTGDVEEVVLKAELGGAIELAGPSLDSNGAWIEVSASDRESEGFSFGPGRTVRLRRWEGGGPFLLRALDPTRTYALSVDPGSRVPWRAENLVVEAGRLSRRTVSFEPGASVRGRVLLPGGEPAANANVRVAPTGDVERFLYGRPRQTSTGPDGSFVLLGIRPTQARVVAELEGYRPATSETLELADGSVLEGLELVLEEGVVLAGRVLLPDGAPAAGASVWVRGAPSGGFWPTVEHTRSDREGRFRIGGLEEAEYSVIATRVAAPGEPAGDEMPDMFARMIDDDPEASRTLRRLRALAAESSGAGVLRAALEGVRAPRDDLELRLAAPPGLVGRVVGPDGAPIPRFRVLARSSADRFGPRVEPTVEVEDPSGRFELPGLFAGEWRLTVEAEGYVQEPQPLEVTVPHEGELRIELARGASLAGVVLDPSGRPVAGAVVAIERGDAGRGGGLFMGPRFGVARRETRTDAAGAFRLGELAPGAGRLVARHEDWAPSEPAAFSLAAGEASEGFELRLRLGGTLIGEVYDAEGRPQAGRPINVMRFDGGDEPRQTTSDADGRFRFEHLAPGKVQVLAQPGRAEIEDTLGGEGRPGPLEFMKLLEMETAEIVDGETTTVVLGAPPRAPVRVFGVVTRNGEPLSGGSVFALPEGRGLLAGMEPARIGPDGGYELVLDEPGDVVFVVGEGEMDFGGIEFRSTIPEVDELRLDLELPGGRIAGRVVDRSGRPIPGQRVRLRRTDAPLGMAAFGGRNEARSGEDGSFAFADLAPGRYAVEAGGGIADGVRLGARVVDGLVLEEDGVLEGIEIELARAGTLTGVVVAEDGAAVPGASVYVRDASGTPLAASLRVRTDESGRFTFEGVSPGEVTVGARAGERAAREVGPVVVREGAPTEVELVLEQGTVLRVIAEDGAGQPLRARVSVRDAAGRELSDVVSPEDVRNLFAEGVSSRERRVGPLAPGRYTVTVTTEDGRVEDRTVRLTGRRERIVRLRFRDDS